MRHRGQIKHGHKAQRVEAMPMRVQEGPRSHLAIEAVGRQQPEDHDQQHDALHNSHTINQVSHNGRIQTTCDHCSTVPYHGDQSEGQVAGIVRELRHAAHRLPLRTQSPDQRHRCKIPGTSTLKQFSTDWND